MDARDKAGHHGTVRRKEPAFLVSSIDFRGAAHTTPQGQQGSIRWHAIQLSSAASRPAPSYSICNRKDVPAVNGRARQGGTARHGSTQRTSVPRVPIAFLGAPYTQALSASRGAFVVTPSSSATSRPAPSVTQQQPAKIHRRTTSDVRSFRGGARVSNIFFCRTCSNVARCRPRSAATQRRRLQGVV